MANKEFNVKIMVTGYYKVNIPNTMTNENEIKDYCIDCFEDEDFGALEEMDCEDIQIHKNENKAVLELSGYYSVCVCLDVECSKEDIENEALDIFNDEDFGPLEDIECDCLNYSSDEGEYNF